MYDWKLGCQIMSLFTAGEEQSLTRKVHESALADSPRGALGTKFSGLREWCCHLWCSTDTPRVGNKNTRKADSGPAPNFEEKNGFYFFQDSFETQILQTVVNRVTKSHPKVIIYGSGNDFLLFPIDIFPFKGGLKLLSNTDTPSVVL